MQKSIKKYKIIDFLIFGTFILFFLRSVLPLNDLFYCFYFMSNAFILIYFFKRRNEVISSVYLIWNNIKDNKYICIIILCTIVFDVVNSFRSNVSFVLSRYWLTLQFFEIAAIISIWYYSNGLNSEKLLKKTISCISFSSFFLFIIVFINFISPIFETPYLTEISTKQDYNSFTRYFLFSFCICANYFVREKNADKKNLCFFVMSLFITSLTVLLSTSNRSYIIFFIVFIICGVYYIKFYISNYSNKFEKYSKLIVLSLMFFLTVMIAYYSQDILQNSIEKNNLSKIERMEKLNGVDSMKEILEFYILDKVSEDDEIIIDTSNESALKRIDKAYDTHSFIGKRLTIWKIAFEEIESYNVKDLVIGKGINYSTELYEKKSAQKQLQKAYDVQAIKNSKMHTHNFILQHILEGGIIRLLIEFSILFFFLDRLTFKSRYVKNYWLMQSTMFILIMLNIMVSYNKGFLGDDYAGYFITTYFWVTDINKNV